MGMKYYPMGEQLERFHELTQSALVGQLELQMLSASTYFVS